VTDESRASDAEREQAVARLREASAEGRLTLEELAERTAWAYDSTTHAELEKVTRDLPAATAAPSPERRARGTLVAIFAPLTRRNRRPLPERTLVLSIFAPVRLDLRETTFVPGEAEIVVLSLFGPVFVTVPEHVDVDTSVVSVFAPVRHDDSGPVPPAAPRLRVRGLAFFAPLFVNVARR